MGGSERALFISLVKWFWFCTQGTRERRHPSCLTPCVQGEQGGTEELVYRALTLNPRVGGDIGKSSVTAAPPPP